jgi:ubiquinone/menaquinone biosynthesis C-methylase UbiE
MVHHQLMPMSEADRIRNVYETGYSTAKTDWSAQWSPRNLSAMYYRHQVERALVAGLNKSRIDLSTIDVLDVGCGSAPHLRFFSDLGADRARLYGIDLVPERIEAAKRLAPDFHLAVADATDLPFPDDSFDLVAQFTALCNIGEDELLKRAALEMTRVLRPSGAIVWFGLIRAPASAHYRAVTVEQLSGLFPDLQVTFTRTMFHRWTEMLGGRFPDLCIGLERLPLPKTNLLAILR